MKITSPKPPLLPPKGTTFGLFTIGSTLGPVVDSFHNQCLLEYDFAPISLSLPSPDASLSVSSMPPIFCSSWAVPPLLGFAYVVLGYILPRIIESLGMQNVERNSDCNINNVNNLRNRAILAVSSTALIIKLSEYLETHNNIIMNSKIFDLDAKTNLAIMTAADALQWIALDQTPVALIAAALTAFGGPLSELPFVANGFWHYIPEAADYLPLDSVFFQRGGVLDAMATNLLGREYKALALSSITGPCYFAVTMDAIALGRYFYAATQDEEKI